MSVDAEIINKTFVHRIKLYLYTYDNISWPSEIYPRNEDW